ncbi:4-oxalomesaconate tautomerase [Microbacterium sediminis]|nr:4-oxalomesaconate tautomerase [Microbacterium sediminis]
MTGGIPCILMRGGTSKGAYFLASDLPAEREARDALLLRVMGTPDARQIDGVGGAHPLTSKVAIVAPSADDGADVDYLFLQTGVDEAFVSDRQNCGNIIAGVGPFAVERGLVTAADGTTSVRIRMLNTGGYATATFATPGGVVDYDGELAIDGVPGTAGAIALDFQGVAGSTAGALFPTGAVRDEIDGTDVTCVDNGMPSVLFRAADLGIDPDASPAELDADAALADRLERLRLAAAERMGLGDVAGATIPKLVAIAEPRAGGALATRTFLPQGGKGFRTHTSIGVLGALTVAAGVAISDSVGAGLVTAPAPGDPFVVEHPTGHFDVDVAVERSADGWRVTRSVALRTARKLFEGTVYPRPRL